MIDRSTQHLQPAPPGDRKPKSAGGHGLMMIACCIPMLVIAIALVATGVVGASFIFVAVACTAMMALMMRGMHHDGQTGAVMDHHDEMDHSGSRPLPPPPLAVRRSPNDR